MCIWNRFCSYSFIFHPYHLTLSHLKLSSHFPAKTKPSQSYVIIFLILARGRFRKKLRNEASVQRSSSSTPSNPPFERSLCWGSTWGKNGKQVSCNFYISKVKQWPSDKYHINNITKIVQIIYGTLVYCLCLWYG